MLDDLKYLCRTFELECDNRLSYFDRIHFSGSSLQFICKISRYVIQVLQ